MHLNISITNWQCNGVINHYRLNHVDKILNKMKLYTAGMVRLIHPTEDFLLLLPVVAQETVDSYREGFTAPILLDRRDDAHIIDLKNNHHYIAVNSSDSLDKIFSDVIDKQKDYICKRLGWQQNVDYVGNCLNIENNDLVKLPQKYFPTIYANIRLLHAFTKYIGDNLYNHYFISIASNKKLVLVIRQTLDDQLPPLSSDDYCLIVRTYPSYQALITGLAKTDITLSNEQEKTIKGKLINNATLFDVSHKNLIE